MDIIKIAQRYTDAGFSPIPLVPNSKRPALKGWQQHAEKPIEDFDVFKTTNGIGLVMGYDGVQCLDIDAKHFEGDEYNDFVALIEQHDPTLIQRMVIQQTAIGWLSLDFQMFGNCGK